MVLLPGEEQASIISNGIHEDLFFNSISTGIQDDLPYIIKLFSLNIVLSFCIISLYNLYSMLTKSHTSSSYIT